MATPRKDEVITLIEDKARDGKVFDEATLKILRKLSIVDLYTLQIAFRDTFDIGFDCGAESEEEEQDKRSNDEQEALFAAEEAEAVEAATPSESDEVP